MLETNLFQGDLVRLTVEDAESTAKNFSRWQRDSEYFRLLMSEVSHPRSAKSIQSWIEKAWDKQLREFYLFTIRNLEDDRLIGEIELGGMAMNQGEAFVGISIGERELWGKGYGTDAMRLILNFAFLELNLRRISLDVFDYNPRAIRSYEKSGFIHEGRQRGMLKRDGRRGDILYMGILRDEWIANIEKVLLKGDTDVIDH